MGPPPTEANFDALCAYLLDQSRLCVRDPRLRFAHPWMAPMPASEGTWASLSVTPRESPARRSALSSPGTGDGFKAGDYSLGLFHHDLSEAAIELVRHEGFGEAIRGSLLCFLDTASPNGCIHRSELPFKTRDFEPAKPVMARLASRIVQALGPEGTDWALRHQVLERLDAFIRYWEVNHVGGHGLFLTPSSMASGFDSDILTAHEPSNTIEAPDTNTFMALEYESMADLCSRLGEARQARDWERKAISLRGLINQLLWHEDERGGFYRALKWRHGVADLDFETVGLPRRDGSVEPLESWTTLLPLYAGIPSAEQAARMVRRLTDPEGYWSPWGVRTLPKWSPFFTQSARCLLYNVDKKRRGPVSNWSGPIWVLSSYYLAEGLARYGYARIASELALNTLRLLAQGLKTDGGLRECYDDDGRGLWPPEGTFISWNVLALTLLREHVRRPSTN